MLEAVRVLVEYGADTEARNDAGLTPLCLAVERSDLSIIKTLISVGAAVNNWGGYSGGTALHIAVSKGFVEAAVLLLDLGAEVDARNDNGVTPLCLAVEKNNLVMVKILIDAGAEVNSFCGWWGETALHVAVCESNLEGIQTLLQFGANMYAENNNGLTPFHLAIMKNNLKVIKLLVSKGADLNRQFGWLEDSVLHFAVTEASFDTVQNLVSLGADVNIRDKNGGTPLHIAAKEGKIAVLELFLRETNNSINLKDNNNWTLLHWAAFHGHREMCELLLERGVDICSKDSEGQIPLHLAAREGHTPVVKLLLEWGRN